ncbi:MAG: uracil-DNA glycosylase [Alphaproteobacteria bacterium]|nr:uracil-DNA glycosylase [Alphaproteobacteria bacterium]
MTARNKQLITEICTWYKTFGIDHIFNDLNSIPTKAETPVPKTQHILKRKTLDELIDKIHKIDCNLKNTARNTVISDGDPSSNVMIIGEAPGQEEDEQGKPFVGQSGQLLNNALKSVGLKRSDVYITNIVFWRPPGNRTPSLEETSLCMPYVIDHIMLINPKVLILLGSVAVQSVLQTKESISKLRGRTLEFYGIPVIPTFHPAYLLRSPTQKSLVFKDLIKAKKILDTVASY